VQTSFDFTILFDGLCPLCRREIRFLKRLDKKNRLMATDITAPGFDPAVYGKTQDDVMARIHGVLPDGSIIEGMEVFRRAYKAIGLGWLVGWTRWPLARPIADAGYRWFARNRMRLTFRKDACATDRCAVKAA